MKATCRNLGAGNERRTRSKDEIDGADGRDPCWVRRDKGKKENDKKWGETRE